MLGLCLVASPALATAPQDIPTHIIETIGINSYNTTHDQVYTQTVWRLPPNDPDQINGSYEYYIVRGEVTGTPANFQPVTSRPGFVRNISFEIVPKVGNASPHYVYARNTSDSTFSNNSCVLRPNLHLVGFPDTQVDFLDSVTEVATRACGNLISAPAGIGVRTIQVGNQTQSLVIGVRVSMASDDTGNATNVVTNSSLARQYLLYEGFPDIGGAGVHRTTANDRNASEAAECGCSEVPLDTYTVISAKEFEIRHTIDWHDEEAGGLPVKLTVFAYDNRTRQYMPSCTLIATVNLKSQVDVCGNSTLSAVVAEGISPTPLVPFMDIAAVAPYLGLSTMQASLLWFIVWIGLLTFIGLWHGGSIGGIAGGGMGFVMGLFFGALPLWLAVILFMACTTAIVLHFTTGGTKA